MHDETPSSAAIAAGSVDRKDLERGRMERIGPVVDWLAKGLSRGKFTINQMREAFGYPPHD